MLSRKVIRSYFSKARLDPRKRTNIPLGIREKRGKKTFVMHDAILPESYVEPHLQVDKNVVETLTCLYGEAYVIFFGDSGNIDKTILLKPKTKVVIKPGIYHSVIATQPVILEEEMTQPIGRLYDSKIDKVLAPWKKDLRKQFAISLYAKNPWENFLSHFKFWEEPYEVVDKMVPDKGTIIELGCGEGFLTNYLALQKPERKIQGIEIAPVRLKIAKKRLRNTSYKVGDVVKMVFSKADVFILFHVLHHLPGKDTQEKVLAQVKKALKPRGKLVIVDVHVGPTIKYLAAWIADHFLVPWVFEKRFFTRAYFRSEREWQALLKRLGYQVKTKYETSGRPFPNIIFECKIGQV